MKLLIWDFDGTLGYREGGWSGALLEVLSASGLARGVMRSAVRAQLKTGFPWHAPELTREVGTADAWWARLEPVFAGAFRGVGVERDVARALAPMVRAVYLDSESWRLFPDTKGALEALSGVGWTHALLSNHVPELPTLLKQLGVHEHFVGIFNSAETGVEKPHARAFRHVLETLTPCTAYMVGDNMLADNAGAEAVGLPAILVRKHDPSAKRFCADLTAVVRFLARV